MLFCERKGKITKQPLVFLHGFLGSHLAWKPFVEHFSKEYSTLTLDLPGHGNSSNVGWQEIEEAIPRESILIGYSMGGRIALSLFLENTKRYHSAIILSANPGLETCEEVTKRKTEEEALIKSMQAVGLETFVNNWYKQPLFGNVTPPPYCFQHNPSGLIHALTTFSITRQGNLWEKLPLPKKPLTFLFGELDEKYVAIGKRIPGAKFIKNAAHSLLLQNRDDSIAAIEEHLKEYLC